MPARLCFEALEDRNLLSMVPVTDGLSLLLDASQGVTVDPVTGNFSWADESGSGHNASQAIQSDEPQLVPNALNGSPVVRFNGVSDILSISGQVLTSQQFTILAVVDDTRNAGDTSFREVFSNWDVSNLATSVFLGTANQDPVRARFTDQMGGAVDPLHPQQGFGNILDPPADFIFTGLSGASDASIFQDDSLIADNGSPLSQVNLATPYFIGSQGDGSAVSEFWQGDIAEVLVYNRALSPGELQQDWAYLGQKYGIDMWINPAGGDWDNANNWSTGAVPGPNDRAYIGAEHGATVTHSQPNQDAVGSLESLAPMVISAGSLALGNTSEINADLTLSGGTLTSAGDLTVNGEFNWSGGTVSGGGTGSLNAKGGMTISGNGNVLDGMTLNNAGSATFAPGLPPQVLNMADGAVIDNLGSFTLTHAGNQSVAIQGNGTFNNYGTFSYSSSSAIETTTVNVAFNNYSLVEVLGGVLSLGSNGPVTSTGGTFQVDSGADLFLQTPVLDRNTIIQGAGGVVFSAQSGTPSNPYTLSFAGTYNVSGGTEFDVGTNDNVDFSQANVQTIGNNLGVIPVFGPGGVVNLGSTPINTTELDVIIGATLTTTASIKTATFNFGGTLNGSGAVEVTGSLGIGVGVASVTLDGRTLTLDNTGSATFRTGDWSIATGRRRGDRQRGQLLARLAKGRLDDRGQRDVQQLRHTLLLLSRRR